MDNHCWDQAIADLERASQRLLAGLPGDLPLLEDALQRRAEAIRRIQTLKELPGKDQLLRLEAALQQGANANQQLLLVREQIRDNIARLNNSSYLTNAFSPNPLHPNSRLDFEG